MRTRAHERANELTCADDSAVGVGLTFRRGIPAFFALLVQGFAEAAAAQMVPVKERDYWVVVTGYSKGARKDAIAKIGSWTEKDLDSLADSTEDLAKAASKCDRCEARQRFDALPLRSAVLLHVERDRADRAARIKERDGEPDCSARAHGLTGERLLKSAALQPGGREFVARLSLAMAMDFRALLCFMGAARWAEYGLKTAPRDAMLLVAQGLTAETIGVTGYTEALPVVSYEWRGGRQFTSVRSDRVDKTRRLNEAREAFEKALSLDPNQEEARVRLGRVLWRLGRVQEAQEPLRKALVATEGEGSIRYLAHLFLGQCLEDSQDMEGAVQQYKAALSLRPDSQISAVALAHVLSLRGDADGARQVLEPVLSFSGRRKTVDPYWLYLTGAPDLGEALLDSLRLESVR